MKQAFDDSDVYREEWHKLPHKRKGGSRDLSRDRGNYGLEWPGAKCKPETVSLKFAQAQPDKPKYKKPVHDLLYSSTGNKPTREAQ